MHLQNSREFSFLMREDRSAWPQCLACHGWLPGLSAQQSGTSWAVPAGDLALNYLESSLGE